MWPRRKKLQEPDALHPASLPPAPLRSTPLQSAGSRPSALEPPAGGILQDDGATLAPAKRRWSRKRKGLAAILVVLAVAAISVSASSLPGLMFPTHPRFCILQVDYTNAYADEGSLCSFGPRLTGTNGELQGANYIAQVFRNAGLTGVEVLEYYVTCYEVDHASLSLVPYLKGLFPNPVVAPQEYEHKTDFTVGAYSGSYTHSRWTDDLEMVFVGNGSDGSRYASAGGRAVIATNDGGIGNTQLYLNAWAAGASASIIHNVAADKELGCPAISYSADGVDSSGHTVPLPDNYSGNAPDIPNLMVSKMAGEDLLDGIDSQSRLRLDIQVTVEKRPCRVVVGDKKGSVQPDKIIMIGAHHDTTYLSPGAVDNTAGTAGLLGIAREIGKLNPAKTVRFATFGGEEEGILGSYEYFKAYSSKLKGKLEFMLNMDMCNIDTKRSHTLPIVVNDAKYLGVLGDIKAEAYRQVPILSGYDVALYQGVLNSSSDMATFALENYKVSSCWGSGSYEYHTTKDTIDRINPESFLVVGAVYGSFAYYLAGGRP